MRRSAWTGSTTRWRSRRISSAEPARAARRRFVGINVTVPHKQAVMPFVKPDEIARAVGAVNTIDFRSNIGTNTDVAGFMDDLRANGVDPAVDAHGRAGGGRRRGRRSMGCRRRARASRSSTGRRSGRRN
ncbi:MAG: hypothetical protein U0521_07725 [Anaerolineae bacterium]